MPLLRFPAIEIRQGLDRTLYLFAVDGKMLPSFVSISRIGRDATGELRGYQRPEILSHIREIRAYLESERPMLPNALVVAFDNRVVFIPSAEAPAAENASRPGFLEIAVEVGEGAHDHPGWLVDGQQRAAALREARISSFPVAVVGFLAASVEEQREQFILVNATKPLPKGLIHELLPDTDGPLPSLLQRRRYPAGLAHRLNRDADSPFFGLVCTPTNPNGIVKDNSLIRMIENSLSDGVLYQFRVPVEGNSDPEPLLRVLKEFWRAAAEVFAEAWALPPRRSRLMHGAGIVSLGFVMDAIADAHRESGAALFEVYRAELGSLKSDCRWTSGFWDFGPGLQRKWNELQNTSRDIQLLSNYLLIRYRARVLMMGQPSDSSAGHFD